MTLKKYFTSLLLSVLTLICIAMPNTAQAAEQAKVNVVYFYGAECPHCKDLAPWLDGFIAAHKDDVNVTKYEFWHDKKNAELFANTMRLFKVPDGEAGAPSIVVNNKVLIGTKQIREELEKEVQEELKKRVNLNGLLTDDVKVAPYCDFKVPKKEINMGAITLTALADSVNPCAMMVLVILLSSLMVRHEGKRAKLAVTAASFIVAVFITYFALGFGLSTLIAESCISQWILTAVGGLAIAIGLAELKDAFWYRKGSWAMEIPMAWRSKLNKVISAATTPAGAFVAGIVVTLFELPCTGGPYLFGISLISMTDSLAERMALMGYYNLIFVLPLVVITLLVLAGKTTIEKAEAWRNKNVKAMHFIIGVIMIAMGVWVLFFR